MPAPGSGAEAVINSILHWEIAGTVIVDIMAIRTGFSFGRKFGQGKSIEDSVLLTGDFFVSMPPTGGDDSFFRLRALNGEDVAFAIEGVGWRLGSFHLEGVSMPDGVVAFFGPVGLIISELGLVAEEGASYFSFSGGLMIELPSGFAGGLAVRRLRFRVAGDQTRPAFKLDGFFLFLRGPTLLIEAGGYFTQEVVGGTARAGVRPHRDDRLQARRPRLRLRRRPDRRQPHLRHRGSSTTSWSRRSSAVRSGRSATSS